MPFYPNDALVPNRLQTDELLLRPLRATDCDLDYDAVMSSAEQLLVQSRGRWPRPGFRWEENLADLQAHEADHLARRAFTFTVMNPSETECLGCIYLNPLRSVLEGYGASNAQLADVGDSETSVHFWVRTSRLTDGLDAQLFAALRGWLAGEWAFRRSLFRANTREDRRLRLCDAAGLRPLIVVPASDGSAPTTFFG